MIVPEAAAGHPLTPDVEVLELASPVGPGRVHLSRPPTGPATTPGGGGVLVLGHGAGPRLDTVDLVAAQEAAVQAGWVVAIIEQPWLVAGGRVAARPAVLDVAWSALVDGARARLGLSSCEAIGTGASRSPRLVVGGRSAGARVACRTASALGAAGVLCLSFPLHPPGRPERTRAAELMLPIEAGLPVTIVQGERDPFGSAARLREVAGSRADVHPVPGTHTIPAAAATAVQVAVAAALACFTTGSSRQT